MVRRLIRNQVLDNWFSVVGGIGIHIFAWQYPTVRIACRIYHLVDYILINENLGLHLAQRLIRAYLHDVFVDVDRGVVT